MEGRPPFSVARGALQALLLAALLTAAMAAPVLVAPAARLFGRETGGRQHDPFTVIEQLRSALPSAPYLQPATDLPGAALARLVGAVPAYNALVLGSFPLAAVAAYLLARRLTGTHGLSLLAALAYAFAPFHLAHAAYHPHVAQTQWLPLYLLALWAAVADPRPGRLAALLAAAALLATADFYAGFAGAVVTPLALVGAPLADGARPRAGGRLAALAVLGLPALAAFALAWRRWPALFDPASVFAFPRADLFRYAALARSYLTPPVEHPLLGAWARHAFAQAGVGPGLLEQQISLGVGWTALAALPLVRGLRGRRDFAGAPAVPALALVAATAFVCSLSPAVALGPVHVLLPSHVLHLAFPMFRAYARFASVVGLAVVLLAAMGAGILWRSGGGGGRLVAAGLLALGAFEYAPAPPWRWRDVLPTQAHRFLAGQPPPVRLLDCVPGRPAEHPLAEHLGHPVSFLGAPFEDCGEPQLAAKLAALSFTHLLLRDDGPEARALGGSRLPDGLVSVRTFPDSVLFRVAAPRPRVYVAALVGFHPREYAPGGTWRWMAERGALRIVDDAFVPVCAALEIELASAAERRVVEFLLEGEAVGTRTVLPGPAWHRLRLRLRPGTNTLALRPLDPPVVAGAFRGNDDLRLVSIAVHRWQWVAQPGAEDGSGPACAGETE